MPADQRFPAAPLFDRTADGRTFVPTAFRTAGARGGGQGRPSGRRASALPLRAASPPARSCHVGIVAFLLGLGLSSPGAAASAARIDDWGGIVAEAATRFDLPPAWILAVMRAESAFNPRAVSPKGAIGLMQVMPGTYDQLRDRYGLGADPRQPRDNILAGAAYLREMYDRFGGDGVFAAYNAGPSRYAASLDAGQALPAETRSYVAAVVSSLMGPSGSGALSRGPATQPPTVFVQLARPADPSADAGWPSPARFASPLFVALTPSESGR